MKLLRAPRACPLCPPGRDASVLLPGQVCPRDGYHDPRDVPALSWLEVIALLLALVAIVWGLA